MQATQYGPFPEPASVWRRGPDKRSVRRLQSDSDEILGPHRVAESWIACLRGTALGTLCFRGAASKRIELEARRLREPEPETQHNRNYTRSIGLESATAHHTPADKATTTRLSALTCLRRSQRRRRLGERAGARRQKGQRAPERRLSAIHFVAWPVVFAKPVPWMCGPRLMSPAIWTGRTRARN
jgi:hypothetical protein